MNSIRKIIIGIALIISPIYSQTNISFKFGLPLSSAQLLLKERKVGGKKIVPTIRTGYFHIGQSVKGEGRDESIGAHLFVPSIGIRTGHNNMTVLRCYWLVDAFTVGPIFTGTDKIEI